MAIFHMDIRSIKRSAGQQATGAAAYRAGESIRDERTGNVHNHSRRKDVRHSEIFLPSKLDASNVAWAQDRVRLWNTAEATEKRRDSRVAREFQVALPPELTPDQRLALARSFSRELADRYGVAVDLAIHDPKPGRESQNFHAHMLTTTREVTPTGLGAKTGLDMRSVARAQRGLSSHSEEYSVLRERWATLTNQALREANVEARVDHRSLAAQGIDRKPLLHVPLEFYQLERKGMPKEVAERLREDYRTRLSAYRERSLAPRSAETVAESRAQGIASAAVSPSAAPGASAALSPSIAPGASPAVSPRIAPAASAAVSPSIAPAASAAVSPSIAPAASAAVSPSIAPAASAAVSPSIAPAASAAVSPSAAPGASPAVSPSAAPGASPAVSPSIAPAASSAVSPSIARGAASATAPAVAPGVARAIGPPVSPSIAPRNSEEIRRRAVQAWLRMRSKEGESTSEAGNEPSVSRGTDKGRDR